jgi:hypothetical protein
VGTRDSLTLDSDVLWMIKTDSLGDTLWTRTYRPDSTWTTYGHCVVETRDEGYVLVGLANCPDTSLWCAYIVRTDGRGDSLWTRQYGAPAAEANCIVEMPDGGFTIVGTAYLSDSETAQGYVLRLNSRGDSLWCRCFGGRNMDQLQSLCQTRDGGFVAAGVFASTPSGDQQAWLFRIDSLGNLLWSRTYGWPSDPECFEEVAACSDGGFVAAGATYSVGNGDFYVVRTDSLGDTLWTRTMGGRHEDDCEGLDLTADGGVVLGGTTCSYGSGGGDFWLIKLDSSGNAQWSRIFGTSLGEDCYAVKQTRDSGYVLAGHATLESNWYGFYLIKTDDSGSAAIAAAPNPRLDPRSDKIAIREGVLARGRSSVRYFLPVAARTRIETCDAAGRMRAVICVGDQGSGWHDEHLPLSPASGVWFVRVVTPAGSATGKVVVIR